MKTEQEKTKDFIKRFPFLKHIGLYDEPKEKEQRSLIREVEPPNSMEKE